MPRPPFRSHFIKYSLLMSAIFIVLNGFTLWRGSPSIQSIDVIRLVLSSIGVGCLGGAVTWLLPMRRY